MFFCNLIALVLGPNSVKSPGVIKIVKEVKTKGVRRDLESKKCFERQSLTKYVTLTVVFM